MREFVAERIVVRILVAPIDEPVPMSFALLTSRRTCLVEVHAGGLVGVGESWINYPEWAPRERVATLLEGIAPVILGTDVTDPAATLDRMAATLLGVARQWGAPGPMWQAMSAIDLALWDLAGKRAMKPVGHLLGGARTSAPVYGSGIGPDRVEVLCERVLELGLGAVKAKIGFGDRADRMTIAAIRRTAPELRIFADANCAWSPSEAERAARTLRDEGVEWLEEPLSKPSLDGLARLHDATGMPLAAGENVYGLDDLRQLAGTSGVAHVQPDPAKCGGITVASRLAASLDECLLSPHWYAGAIGLRASLALATGLEKTGWIELDVRPNPLRDAILTGGFELRDGALQAAHAPGLVSDLDWDRALSFQQYFVERTAP